MSAQVDVLVAGAGPTGLALACGLLANGITVCVVDKAVEPAGTSRALGLQPRGIEVVDRLGAFEGLPERALQVDQIVVHINGKHAADVRIGQRTALVTRPGLVISQADVEAGLRRRVEELGGGVEWGRELVDARQDAHGISATLADGNTVQAGWLVGCDGAHSRVRDLADVGFPGVPLPERFLMADVHADLSLSRRSIYTWLAGDSVFGAFPLPGRDLWRLIVPVSSDAADEHAGLAQIGRLFEERTGYPASVIRDPEWVTSFRLHRRLADTYRDRRILLAGDAAHVFSPFGGQGMNTGIGDAENLAWKLALVINGTAEVDLLDTYEGERRPITGGLLKSTSAIGKLMLGNHLLARLMRDRVVIPLMNRPGLQRRLWENLSQLKASYRTGPLGQQAGYRAFSRDTQPGDRVADVECVRVDGSQTHLHAELGSRWALIGPPGTAGAECAAVAAKRLGAGTVTVVKPRQSDNGDVMLVRPDAHLGWRGRDPAALDVWVAGMLGRGRAGWPLPGWSERASRRSRFWGAWWDRGGPIAPRLGVPRRCGQRCQVFMHRIGAKPPGTFASPMARHVRPRGRGVMRPQMVGGYWVLFRPDAAGSAPDGRRARIFHCSRQLASHSTALGARRTALPPRRDLSGCLASNWSHGPVARWRR
jgi:4,5-epoxidase